MTGSPSNMPKLGFQTVLLPRLGGRPLRFSGALLVEGCSTAANDDPAQESQPQCCVKVYERASGFVAQIMLTSQPGAQPLSVLKTHTAPLALRHWIEHFDPALGVDVSDINAQIGAGFATNPQDLSQAAETIRKRLERMRNAYTQAARNALGLPHPGGACAA